MKLFTNLLIGAALTSGALAETKPIEYYIEVNPTRFVSITSEIGSNGVAIANQIMQLTNKDTSSPIYMLINSPGGSTLTGNLIMQAMDMAQLRGVKFNCISSIYVASMAFNIFNKCDNRFAFSKTLLLFHPVRFVNVKNLTGVRAAAVALELLPLDAELLEDLKVMGMDPDVLKNAFYEEKLWTAKELAKATKPGYIVLIRDIRGIPNPFAIGGI